MAEQQAHYEETSAASVLKKRAMTQNTKPKLSSLAELPKAQFRSVLTFGWPGVAGSRGLAGMGQA